MIKNYLKIAWRSVWKHKLFSLINITSLAIGLSASFVIGLLVYYDLTFDKFHQDSDRIYRITSVFTSPEGPGYNRGVPIPLAEALNENTPGINTVSRFYVGNMAQVENQKTGKSFKYPGEIIFADPNYFRLFDYSWLAGDATQLSKPNEMVLTEERAKKYFPDLSPQEVIGNTLIYNDSIAVNVSGIVAGFKDRSDFIFEEFISLNTATQTDYKDQIFNSEWGNTNSASQLFIKIDKNVELSTVQSRLDKLAKAHEDDRMKSFGQSRVFHLQPLGDLHFNTNFYVFDISERQADRTVLISLAFVALFLLILGIINFINLNTAQAAQRAKEIGIRKTLGSSKKQLIFQFLGESFLLTLAAAFVSIFLSSWLLKLFSGFVPNDLGFSLFNEPLVIGSVVILIVSVTLLSGFYPALVLSGFKPISVLKNQISIGNTKAPLRKYLTVFQFVIAQVFIIATILVTKQIQYLSTKHMGFETEAVAYISIPRSDRSSDKREILKTELEKIPQIKATMLGNMPPASNSSSYNSIVYFDKDKEIKTKLALLYGNKQYLDFYNIKLLAGRKPLKDSITEFVINRTCLSKLGFTNPQDAIGKTVKLNDNLVPIVGVMEDFNQRSLVSKIEPMAFVGSQSMSNVHIKLQREHPENWHEAISAAEKTFKSIYPEDDFMITFVDDTIKRFYTQERKTATLLNWATGLSILISCLGLLGLVIHTTERRTKEIGIRKVLGASVFQLNLLLSSEFLKLVGIAFLIAAPIAWYGIHNWLKGLPIKPP